MNALFYIAVSGLAALAIMQRRDACAWTLAIGLVASMLLAESGQWSAMPGAASIDAVTCLVMLAVWTRHTSMRAWTIGFIGLAKCGASFGQYLVDPAQVTWGYAAFINVAFVVQVLVAGGWIDAVGNRLDRVFARIAPVRHRLLRDGS